MIVERTQAVFEQWLALAVEGGDFLSTVGAFTALDGRVHLPNGIIGSSEMMAQQVAAGRMMFPDMAVEIERPFFLPDQLIVQGMVSGTLSPALPHLVPLAGSYMRCPVILVATLDRDGRFSDIWPYVNAGAAAVFPLDPGALDVPYPTSPSPSGTEAQARALFQAWTVQMAVSDYVTAIFAVSEPDALVYPTNGAVGDLDMFAAHAAIMANAYPDLAMEIEGVLFFEDRVLIQLFLTATHTGRLGMWEPTGRHVRFTGVLMLRVGESGRAVEIWPLMSPGSPLIFPVQYP